MKHEMKEPNPSSEEFRAFENAKPRAGEYTPAPWYSDQDGFIYTERDDEDQIVVSKAHEHPRMNATLMNARRIVACVNACEGIPNEDLPNALRNAREQDSAIRTKVETNLFAARVAELEDGLEQALNSWRTAVLHLPGNINTEIDRIAKLRILLAKHGR